MALMSELQYYSPGKQIYYWFADAFGVLKPEGGYGSLLYLGTKAQVSEALASGKPSWDLRKNAILQQELASAPEYYQKLKFELKGEKQGEFTGLSN